MTKEELEQKIFMYSLKHGISRNDLEPVQKSNLKSGFEYSGISKNSNNDTAIWCEDHFEYLHKELDKLTVKKVNDYEDDTEIGDVFIPMKLKS